MITEAPAETAFGTYDFGLTAEEEERARRLHQESVVIDMLYWGPVTYLSFTPELEADLLKAGTQFANIEQATHASIQRNAGPGGALDYEQAWRDSGITAGSRNCDLKQDTAFFTFGFQQHQFDNFPWLIKALKAEDIRRAKREGKHAGWMNTQMVGTCTLDQLDAAYQLGLRMFMLTYNNMNHIGAGCTERTDAGVSNYGARMIKRMNELGIIVDTSHCGRRTTLDACELSDAPVIVSHACCEGILKHARSKSDAELEAIGKSGGIFGVVTVPFFLTNGEGTMDDWLDHVDYAVGEIGWEHVGVGSDWPMMFPKEIVKRFFSPANLAEIGFRPEDNIQPERNLVGFDDYRDFPNITRGLVKRGYNDEQIRGILGENFLRVFEQVCG